MKSTMRNMLLSLTAIAATMGAVLATVHQLTLKPILDGAIKAKIEALAEVLPPFDNDPSAQPCQITLEGDDKPVTLYRAESQGKPVGVAVETWTLDGFSGEITMMVGFDLKGEVTGYKVLSHAETPGLGAKADVWFRDPTGSRSIIGSQSELAVAKDGGNIDGITAATITSRAVLDAVNRARMAFNKENLQ